MMGTYATPIGIGFGIPSFPRLPTPSSFNTGTGSFSSGTVLPRSPTLNAKTLTSFKAKHNRFSIHTIRNSSSSDPTSTPSPSPSPQKTPFGYTRKDVLLIGLGVTFLGVALKTGLEFVGVDPLQAGNVVQLVLVLGLTIGWISTYIFRVSNKEMTYAQQLRDYENKVMEKRLESLTEAELEALLEEIEEEKRR